MQLSRLISGIPYKIMDHSDEYRHAIDLISFHRNGSRYEFTHYRRGLQIPDLATGARTLTNVERLAERM